MTCMAFHIWIPLIPENSCISSLVPDVVLFPILGLSVLEIWKALTLLLSFFSVSLLVLLIPLSLVDSCLDFLPCSEVLDSCSPMSSLSTNYHTQVTCRCWIWFRGWADITHSLRVFLFYLKHDCLFQITFVFTHTSTISETILTPHFFFIFLNFWITQNPGQLCPYLTDSLPSRMWLWREIIFSVYSDIFEVFFFMNLIFPPSFPKYPESAKICATYKMEGGMASLRACLS